MATNIVETIQKNLGYPALQKIDPNIQEAKNKQEQSSGEKLAQGAIPAILIALYKFTRTDEGCNIITSGAPHDDWLSIIYAGKEEDVVEKVAQYAGVTAGEADSHMEKIADEAVRLLKEASGKNDAPEKLKTYMNGQRHNILVYLPAAMNLGDMLDDEALDDRTNKMEGPVSNWMHRIENTLSDGDKKKGIF